MYENNGFESQYEIFKNLESLCAKSRREKTKIII